MRGRTTKQLLVQGVYLKTANVGVLAVLVVLLDMHLHNPAAQRVSVCSSATARDGNVLPANRVCERNLGELNQVMVARAGIEDDMGRGVRLVLVVVDVEPDGSDLNAAQEVDGD